ncbi:MAG TPA: GNAT family N-acetyltransferase [Thermoplasmata archaeon]|nr:GNAT family N-acetyltransferase [Thermoplasmata archaeon]
MSGNTRVVPIATSKAEALRLLAELSEALAAEAGEESRATVTGLEEAVRAGDLPGALWVGPKDEAVGMAWWEPPSEVGRRAGLFLATGYRTEAALDGLIEAVEAIPDGPLLEVADRIPGVPPSVRAPVLAARGFVPVSRIDLAWPVGRPLLAPSPLPEGTARALRPDDEATLAALLDRAYADNPIDRALFRQRRDAVDDARDAAHLLLAGQLGPWIASASFGAEVGGEVVGATLVNDYRGALITEVMVDPRHRRRGLARGLLLRSLAELVRLGRDDIRLVVTLSNEGAYRLYSSLGFAPLPATQGSTWLHAGRLGLPGPPPVGGSAPPTVA